MEYLLHVLILVTIYIMLSVSLNLISGYTGLLSVSHAALFGFGAYISALLSLHFHSNFLLSLIFAAAGTGLVGLLIAAPSLRIHDDYFVLATFAFQILAFNLMNNWVALTGGPMGLSGIPQPSLFGLAVESNAQFLVLAIVLAGASTILCWRLVHSPFGRVLKAIREDEVLTQSLGKNVTKFKLQVFIIGGMLAATAGVLYAHYMTFIDPTSFTVQESIFILTIVIVGGSGSITGSVVGSILLVMLPEALRVLGLPSSIAANVRQMIYGILLILCMMFRPQGIMGGFLLRRR